jgi:hypothetical protein
MKPRLFLAASIAILSPALLSASPPQVPLPQMKPCVAIDDMAITNVIRVVKLVAKSDYVATRSRKKVIFDRLQQ